MKKLFVCLLILMLAVCSVAAAEIDLSQLSETELRTLIDQARIELQKFTEPVVEGTTIYEDEFIKMDYSSVEISNRGMLSLNCLVQNKTEGNIYVRLFNVLCNGWDIKESFTEATVEMAAGSKKVVAFEFPYFTELSGITRVEDIQEIKYTLLVWDRQTREKYIDIGDFYYIDMPSK